MFVDTGPCNDESWPVGDPERPKWLRRVLQEKPGRAKIVFAHHSRLSRGKHGDNDTVAALWDCLFDDSGAPLAALTVGGHDHNVTWYAARPKVDPDRHIVPFERGIHVHVNGAGGHGHDETSGIFTGFFRPISGTTPQFADDDNWCVTRIDLIGPRAADVSILSFGTERSTDGDRAEAAQDVRDSALAGTDDEACRSTRSPKLLDPVSGRDCCSPVCPSKWLQVQCRF